MAIQRLKVLIVEDEPWVAEDIRIQLQQGGYQVVGIAESGAEALDCVAHSRPDVVLMDIILAGDIDGIQAAELIRERFGAPVVYLTAHGDQALLDRAKITEPLGYLIKPCDFKDLHATLTVAFYKAECERHLRENNLLDATVVSLSDALIAWDSEGKVIRVNQALSTLLAIDAKTLLARNVLEAIDLSCPDSGKPLTEGLIHSFERLGKVRDDRDLLIARPDLRTVPVRVSGNRIVDERQKCLGYVLLIHDDTERQQHIQALKESELRFNQLASELEDLLCICELQQGEVILLNHAYNAIFGRETVSALPINALFIDNTYRPDLEMAQALVRSIHTNSGHETRFRIIRPDGGLRWLQVRSYPVKNPSTGLVYRMGFIIADISARMEAEAKLLRYAKIFGNTLEGIMILDAGLNISDINTAVTAITGFSAEDLHNKGLGTIISDRCSPDFFKTLTETTKQSGRWLGEIPGRRKNGEYYTQWMAINLIDDGRHGNLNYSAIFSDISTVKQSQEKLYHLAHYDHLTGLANQILFEIRLGEAINQADAANRKVAVLLMDIDRFKGVNDSFGHAVGDQLIIQVAERLRDVLGEGDTLARPGGDEFIFIFKGQKHSSEIVRLVERITNLFARPFILEDREIIITVSMGISVYPDNGQNAEELLKQAEMAMYKAKDQGKSRFACYNEDMKLDSVNQLTLTTQMRLGLERQEFSLNYQPQVSLENGLLTGFEALLRWHHPEKGLLTPSHFIPLAEDTGFIEKLGLWVLHEACRQMNAWHKEGNGSITVSVNVSPVQFIYSDMVGTVRDILVKSGLDPRCLELEITETSLMQSEGDVLKKLEALKGLGVRLAIDDFGTGYSSLGYLKSFPIDKLKIDRTFIKNLPDDSQDSAITKAIIDMAKSLGLKVIAEGVETHEQQNFLATKGCNDMQGYLFSAPLPAADVKEQFLGLRPNGS